MEKKFKYQSKGITLISLIVTIVVLLILAGVSIAVLTGENGILNRATSAKTTNEQKTAEEELKLGIVALSTDYYSKTTRPSTFREFIFSDVSKTKLNQELNGDATFNNANYTITYKNITYQVAENGNISVAEGIILVDSLALVKGVDTNYQLTAEQKNINTTLSWDSSNKNVATVDNTGNITIVTTNTTDTETTKITVIGTYNNKNYMAECNVTIAPLGISIDGEENVAIGGSEKLTAIITPQGATNRSGLTISWSSSAISPSTWVATFDSIIGVSTNASVPSGTTKDTTAKIIVTVTLGSISKSAETTITATKDVAYFKTIIDNVSGERVAYYYTGNDDKTGTPINQSNIGSFLGMKVSYTPSSTVTYGKYDDYNFKINIGDTQYRLFYIDIDGKYGEGKGTIFLKADQDDNYTTIFPNSMPDYPEKMNEFNHLWYENPLLNYEKNNRSNLTGVRKALMPKVWENLMDTNGIAKYVVGSPSIELWMDSYNLFLSSNPIEGKKKLCYTVTQDTTSVIEGTETQTGPLAGNTGAGYYVGVDGIYDENYGVWTANGSIVSPLDYASNILKADRVKAWNNGTDRYWLTSPSAAGNGDVLYVRGEDNRLVCTNCAWSSCGFCPIVCCNNDVRVELDE